MRRIPRIPRPNLSGCVDVELITRCQQDRIAQFRCRRERDGEQMACLHLDDDKESVPAICRCHRANLPIWMLRECPLQYLAGILGQAWSEPIQERLH